jgi:hypothetical protein
MSENFVADQSVQSPRVVTKKGSSRPLVRRHFQLVKSSRAYLQVEHMKKVEKALQEGRGQMTKLPYVPMIDVSFCSTGFVTRHRDPATGEIIHCLSSGESDAARSLLWLPGHVRLYSQVALPRQVTMRIADQLGIDHPRFPDRKTYLVMTTDLVHVRHEEAS